MMRPVHHPTQIIPLVHSSKLDPVTDAKRHAFGDVDVVSDQQSAAISQPNDDSLVPRPIFIVGQQTDNETCVLYPGFVVTFSVAIPDKTLSVR
jgi:hypothetical protein